jgi:hypothetical protein
MPLFNMFFHHWTPMLRVVTASFQYFSDCIQGMTLQNMGKQKLLMLVASTTECTKHPIMSPDCWAHTVKIRSFLVVPGLEPQNFPRKTCYSTKQPHPPAAFYRMLLVQATRSCFQPHTSCFLQQLVSPNNNSQHNHVPLPGTSRCSSWQHQLH